MNQAGALVLIYKDGTILVNHGGTEMGQGLHTKMQQVAAAEFGVSPDRVKVNATNTSKVPNTSATAASAGADLNGMAVKNAVDILKTRMAEAIAESSPKKIRPFHHSIIPFVLKTTPFSIRNIRKEKFPSPMQFRCFTSGRFR